MSQRIHADAYQRSEIRDGIRIDWNTPIAIDDGIILRADIFRCVRINSRGSGWLEEGVHSVSSKILHTTHNEGYKHVRTGACRREHTADRRAPSLEVNR